MNGTITIDVEHGSYARISVPGETNHYHYVELSGAYWNLHRSSDGAFSSPVKRWRFKAWPSIEGVIPKALAFVLRSD